MKADIAWQPLNWHPLTWDDLKVGFERTWDVPITYPLIAWYADMAQDPHEWYTWKGSPFGPPVVPPLLMSRLASEATAPIGRMMGFLNTYNKSETLEPTVVGMVVRLRGWIADKYERKGRRYVLIKCEAHDAESGRLLSREEKEYAVPPFKGE